MKSKSWNIVPRWEWEKSKKVVVFSITDRLSDEKSSVINYISELVNEFGIPLKIIDGNLKYPKDLTLVKRIIRESLKNSKLIDYKIILEKKLRMVRNDGELKYGIVIIVDKNEYDFYNESNQQPAIYGIGTEEGLVILIYTHKEAVRHEFAHMLGLNHHQPPNPGCIMNWKCDVSTFCNDCKKKIQEMWKEEIKEGKK